MNIPQIVIYMFVAIGAYFTLLVAIYTLARIVTTAIARSWYEVKIKLIKEAYHEKVKKNKEKKFIGKRSFEEKSNG